MSLHTLREDDVPGLEPGTRLVVVHDAGSLLALDQVVTLSDRGVDMVEVEEYPDHWFYIERFALADDRQGPDDHQAALIKAFT